MADEFKLLGHGFDTIQLSFITQIPHALADAIAHARMIARQRHQPEAVILGPGQIRGEVLSHGGGGGDAIFSTGELGEMYFLKLDQKGDPWGVTVKIRALALLCYGFEGAMERMWDRAKGLGLSAAGYSFGRIDYRFDVQTTRSFALSEECLVTHNRSLVRPFDKFNRNHPLYEWGGDPNVQRLLRGTKIETIMVGKIGSGMQTVIYDKRAESIARRNFALVESYGLDPKSPQWGLIRAEVRYAGDVLKRRWNVRDIKALSKNIQPMIHKAMSTTRYVQPGPPEMCRRDRSRHDLWSSAVDAIPLVTCSQPSTFPPQRAEYLILEERRRSLRANIAGCSVSLAAMDSHDHIVVAELAPILASQAVKNAIVVDPGKVDRAIRRGG